MADTLFPLLLLLTWSCVSLYSQSVSSTSGCIERPYSPPIFKFQAMMCKFSWGHIRYFIYLRKHHLYIYIYLVGDVFFFFFFFFFFLCVCVCECVFRTVTLCEIHIPICDLL